MKPWNRYWSRFWELPTVTQSQPQASPEVLPGHEQLPPTLARQVLQQSEAPQTAPLRQRAAHTLQSSLGNRTLTPTDPGQPLSPTLRSRLESSLNTNLAAVRLHYDQVTPTALDARAFTVGQDIVLSNAADAHDLRLLSHEAAHIVQGQTRGTQPGLAQPDSPTEREADRAAGAIATHQSVAMLQSGSPVPALQRQAKSPASGATNPMMLRETVRVVLTLHYQRQGGKGAFTLTPALKSELQRLLPTLTEAILVALWTPEPASPLEALKRLIDAGLLTLEPTPPPPAPEPEPKA